MLKGDTISERLEALVTRWRDYDGSEASEAQTFLNELFEDWPAFRERLYELNQRIASDPSGYAPFGPASHEPAPTLF